MHSSSSPPPCHPRVTSVAPQAWRTNPMGLKKSNTALNLLAVGSMWWQFSHGRSPQRRQIKSDDKVYLQDKFYVEATQRFKPKMEGRAGSWRSRGIFLPPSLNGNASHTTSFNLNIHSLFFFLSARTFLREIDESCQVRPGFTFDLAPCIAGQDGRKWRHLLASF